MLVVHHLRSRVLQFPLFCVFHDARLMARVHHKAVNPLRAADGCPTPHKLISVNSVLLLLLLLLQLLRRRLKWQLLLLLLLLQKSGLRSAARSSPSHQEVFLLLLLLQQQLFLLPLLLPLGHLLLAPVAVG